MPSLTDSGRRIATDLAARHGVSEDAVLTLALALAQGGGSQAQFSHPDLGGMGQWSQGGMTMVSDMFNNALKARVDGLCSDLANHVRQGDFFAPAPDARAASMQSQQQSSGGYSGGSSYMVSGGGTDWPAGLGVPSSVGAQNDLRYAVFPQTRRLAISHGGRTTVYDTGDHAIGGVSQQQSGDQSLTFTSQHGLVRVADLPEVSPPADAPAPRQTEALQPDRPATDTATATPQPTHREPSTPTPAPAAASAPPARSGGDADSIFATLERLAELHKKGILTDAEFDAKKTDLLSRL